MSATYQLFSEWKARRELQSDNAGAIALGVTRGAVSLWKKGRNAEADVIERMAREIGEDPTKWLALAMAEQTKGEASRAWLRVARQLGAAASVAAVALVVGGIAADRPALANEHILGIMRNAAWAAIAVLAAQVLHARRSLTLKEAPHGPSAMLA